MRKDNAYLEDILRAANAIRRFLAGISPEDFKSSYGSTELPYRQSLMLACRVCLNCSTSFSWAALTSASVSVRSAWR